MHGKHCKSEFEFTFWIISYWDVNSLKWTRLCDLAKSDSINCDRETLFHYHSEMRLAWHWNMSLSTHKPFSICHHDTKENKKKNTSKEFCGESSFCKSFRIQKQRGLFFFPLWGEMAQLAWKTWVSGWNGCRFTDVKYKECICHLIRIDCKVCKSCVWLRNPCLQLTAAAK